MDLNFEKTPYGLRPADPQALEWFDNKLKTGQVVHADFKRRRNYEFHKKFFALLQVGFEYWEPGEIDTKWGKPQKNFDQFRKDTMILAGFGEIVWSLKMRATADGAVPEYRVIAKSMSFANMDEHEFQKLYDKVLTVLMERVLPLTREEIEDLTERYLSFA